ncbi:MAG: aspartyl/asparaginyl beta-hydroxylase domain-containing protein [Rhodospirillum sp.]|nr:aspartyl/asparaginyl beta-hydroxylase domain-containing protein [Rhodospirillum sp.]MCF8492167.1 aspartyl/asparaginyl beta-hydroxylase domain-containing protein [Rhodospirillum sp.]
MTDPDQATSPSPRLSPWKPLWRRLRRKYALYNLAGWLNPIFDIWVGGENRPVFFDIDQEEPALRTLDKAFPLIRDSYDRVTAAVDRLPPYHMIDHDVIYSSGRTQREARWGVFMLTCFGQEPEAAKRLCPELLEMLREIPGIYQAFFSVLEPGKHIPAHVGPSRVYLRYHLGLRVPEENTPYIRAKDQIYTWKTGESMLFDDSWDHEIFNPCSETRAVLIVDLERKMPWPARAIAWFQRATAALHYARRIVAATNKQFPVDKLPPIPDRKG